MNNQRTILQFKFYKNNEEIERSYLEDIMFYPNGTIVHRNKISRNKSIGMYKDGRIFMTDTDYRCQRFLKTLPVMEGTSHENQ